MIKSLTLDCLICCILLLSGFVVSLDEREKSFLKMEMEDSYNSDANFEGVNNSCSLQLDGEWNKTFGGRYWDHGWCVQQTNDGGYIIVGDKSIDELNSAAWIIKTDAYGDIVWEKFFDASAAYVEEVQDGGYIVTGDCYLDPFDSDANIWFIRLDGSGNKVWERIFGSHRGSDVGYCVHQTSDGGYIIAGYTTSYSNTSDAYLIKTDRYGDMIWNKTFSSGCLAGSAYYVEETRDGGFVLTGWDADGLWVIRTNSMGDLLWEKSFGVSMDMGNYVHETSDGGFIVVGSTGLGSGSKNAWLIKLDSNGNMLWNHTFGGGASPNHRNGTEGKSITVAAYPGDFVKMEANEEISTGLHSCIRMYYAGSKLAYWTFSKFTMEAAYSNIEMGGGWENAGVSHLRIIGNDGTTTLTSSSQWGNIITLYGNHYGMDHVYLYGNYLHDQCANYRGQDTGRRVYQVYIGGYGALDHIYIGWNERHISRRIRLA